MTKREFVATYLAPMAKALDEEITSLEYVKATPSNEEYVLVWYGARRRQICVTGDSHYAIVADVLRKICA